MKRGGEKVKKKVKKAVLITFKPIKLNILLPVHACTLQANILHLDKKAEKCTTCKQLCGKF